MSILDEKRLKRIRSSLKSQLKSQNKTGAHYEDLLDHYIELVKLKHSLEEDIRDRGLRHEVISGNGFASEKPNESITNLVKVSGNIMKMLSELGLKDPITKVEKDDLLQRNK